jgi:hypothetical protein
VVAANLEIVQTEDRNRSQVRNYMENIESRGRLTKEQADLSNSVDCKLRTNDECPVALVNLDLS